MKKIKLQYMIKYFKMKNQYLTEQKNKILEFARDEYHKWNISAEKLREVYYHNFIKWK